MVIGKCDKESFYRYLAAKKDQGNLDLLLNGLGNLMTKHIGGKAKALYLCLDLLSLCLVSKVRDCLGKSWAYPGTRWDAFEGTG